MFMKVDLIKIVDLKYDLDRFYDCRLNVILSLEFSNYRGSSIIIRDYRHTKTLPSHF